jgi:hypothetical protein
MTTSFDPTSTEHEISKQYLPDKETSWPYPKEDDGWILDHNVLRGQMQMIREGLEAIQARGQPVVEWEVTALLQAFDHHYVFFQTHHADEDDIFTPALSKRFKFPDKVCMCSQYAGLRLFH